MKETTGDQMQPDLSKVTSSGEFPTSKEGRGTSLEDEIHDTTSLKCQRIKHTVHTHDAKIVYSNKSNSIFFPTFRRGTAVQTQTAAHILYSKILKCASYREACVCTYIIGRVGTTQKWALRRSSIGAALLEVGATASGHQRVPI